jgi:hypothetical protein
MGDLETAESVLGGLSVDDQFGATALLAIAKEDYDAAITQYSSLDTIQNMAYINNLALTHLYTANVQSAIAVLEPVLREQGKHMGVLPHAVYNLCTMYEIRDDKARGRKEGVMEMIVGQYGDVCGKSHFKLDSLR